MKHNIVMLTSRIHDLTHSWLVDALAEAGLTGLAPSHGDVLACLFKEGEATMQKLAAFAHRAKPTTTVLVDKLEKMGLVRRERSEDDARRTRVTLTDEDGGRIPAGTKSRPRPCARSSTMSPADSSVWSIRG